MVLYSTCMALDAIKGRAKNNSCFQILPLVKSFDSREFFNVFSLISFDFRSVYHIPQAFGKRKDRANLPGQINRIMLFDAVPANGGLWGSTQLKGW